MVYSTHVDLIGSTASKLRKPDRQRTWRLKYYALVAQAAADFYVPTNEDGGSTETGKVHPETFGGGDECLGYSQQPKSSLETVTDHRDFRLCESVSGLRK
jgi:hypothetical protein